MEPEVIYDRYMLYSILDSKLALFACNKLFLSINSKVFKCKTNNATWDRRHYLRCEEIPKRYFLTIVNCLYLSRSSEHDEDRYANVLGFVPAWNCLRLYTHVV